MNTIISNSPAVDSRKVAREESCALNFVTNSPLRHELTRNRG